MEFEVKAICLDFNDSGKATPKFLQIGDTSVFQQGAGEGGGGEGRVDKREEEEEEERMHGSHPSLACLTYGFSPVPPTQHF